MNHTNKLILSAMLITTSQLFFAAQEKAVPAPKIPVLYRVDKQANPNDASKKIAITFRDKAGHLITKNYANCEDFTQADTDYDPFKREYNKTCSKKNTKKATSKK